MVGLDRGEGDIKGKKPLKGAVKGEREVSHDQQTSCSDVGFNKATSDKVMTLFLLF